MKSILTAIIILLCGCSSLPASHDTTKKELEEIDKALRIIESEDENKQEQISEYK